MPTGRGKEAACHGKVITPYNACNGGEQSLAIMLARLLTIADESIASEITSLAQSEGWTAYQYELGSGSLAAAQRLRPDLVILDSRSASQSFGELCRCFRSIDELTGATLVALVSPGQPNYATLLEAGADECWSEPLDSQEFRIRLRAVYRRYQGLKASSVIRRGEVELDLDRYTVRSTGHPARLTSSQVTVLKYLMKNSGIFVSHKELLERAWGRSDLDSGAVRACMKRIRNALAATGAENVIRSVRGGYLFDTESAPMRFNDSSSQ